MEYFILNPIFLSLKHLASFAENRVYLLVHVSCLYLPNPTDVTTLSKVLLR